MPGLLTSVKLPKQKKWRRKNVMISTVVWVILTPLVVGLFSHIWQTSLSYFWTSPSRFSFPPCISVSALLNFNLLFKFLSGQHSCRCAVCGWFISVMQSYAVDWPWRWVSVCMSYTYMSIKSQLPSLIRRTAIAAITTGRSAGKRNGTMFHEVCHLHQFWSLAKDSQNATWIQSFHHALALDLCLEVCLKVSISCFPVFSFI